MDNFEDKTKYNKNSAGEYHPLHQNPRQTKDVSDKPNKGFQPIEIVHSTVEPLSVADSISPNHFMEIGGSTQAVQSGDNIVKSMLRFKWMILGIFILVAAPMIAAIWTQISPEYQATAQVRVRPIIPFLVFRTEESGMIPLYSSFVNTQVSIIMGSTVLQRVLDREEIQKTQWYKEIPKPLMQRLLGNPPASHLEMLGDGLSVKPRKDTEIIDVAFVHSNATVAKVILNAILEEYIRYIGERSDATKDKLYSQLVDEYKSLDNEIKGQEAVTAELSKSLGTETPQEFISNKRIRLDEMQSRLSELQQSINILEWEQSQLEDLANQAVAGDVNDVAGGVEEQPEYYEDTEWRALDLNVRTLKHKIATSLLAPKHRNMVLLKEDLRFAEELIRLREEQLDEQWRDRLKNASDTRVATIDAGGMDYEVELASLERKLARTKFEEQLLLEELKKQQTEFQNLFEHAQLLTKENNTLQHKRELFSAVLQRLDQKNVERNVPGSIEVLTRASVLSKPYNDRRILLTATAVLLGFGIGGGVALLRAGKNQIIYTSKDMPYQQQVPFLGYVPVAHDRKSSDKEDDPVIIESIRFLRTSILSRLEGQGNTTVLVTSADAGTGKSTFTMMLGKSLAQAGKKVLIVDADFRKMTLTRRFNLADKSGFLESLYCKSVDKRHIFPTETFGLSIMPVGKRKSDSMIFEETANGAFKACTRQMRKQFDIILLDSSPILPIADATILSSQVDGTIMVERELVSQRANVINALARLGSAGGRLLGTVFVGSGGPGHYGYNYNYSDYGKTGES